MWVITPQATVQTALSDRLTFTGALGVSYASIDDGLTRRHSTGVAADAALCSRGDRDQFCARASINQETATVAGPARKCQCRRGLFAKARCEPDYSVFARCQSLFLTDFVHHKPDIFSCDLCRAAADYTRRLGDRWFAGVSVAARKSTEKGPDPKADISGSLFIRYRLGDLQ